MLGTVREYYLNCSYHRFKTFNYCNGSVLNWNYAQQPPKHIDAQ